VFGNRTIRYNNGLSGTLSRPDVFGNQALRYNNGAPSNTVRRMSSATGASKSTPCPVQTATAGNPDRGRGSIPLPVAGEKKVAMIGKRRTAAKAKRKVWRKKQH
jgi:hypothetical protein